MGLFGGSKNSEDLIYEAISLLEQRQPKPAISLLKKNNHKFIQMKDINDTSSKIELYNSIKDDLESLVNL